MLLNQDKPSVVNLSQPNRVMNTFIGSFKILKGVIRLPGGRMRFLI